MLKFRTLKFGLMLMALLCCAPTFAQQTGDPLTVTLAPVDGAAAQGGGAVFRAVFKNTGTTALYLNQISLLIQDSTNLSGNPIPFYVNFAALLPGGASTDSLPVFVISAPANTTKATYHGTVAILGGADASAEGKIGQADFTLTVTDPDASPPNTTINGGPQQGDTVCSSSVAFSFTGSDDQTAIADLSYQYRVDGGAWQYAAANSVTLSNLTEGTHLFEVSAIDLSGNGDATPDSRNFTVSLAPPNFLSIAPVVPKASQAALSWTTDKTANSAVDYGLTTAYGQSQSSAALVTSHQITLLGLRPNKTYHYRLKSTDFCGRETDSADLTFVTPADTTPPVTLITVGPADNSTDCMNSADFHWTATDDVDGAADITFSYQIDGGNWSPYLPAMSHVFTNLADGPHTFSVRATDSSGNVDSNPPVRHFIVDTSVVALSGVAAAPAALTAVLTWQTTKAATTLAEYRVAGNPNWNNTGLNSSMTLTHSATITGLVPLTNYEYRAHSIDNCGHEAISAIQTFTTLADATPPTTTITGGPAEGAVICPGTATFTFTGSDNYSPTSALLYKYRLDGGAYSAFASATSATFNALADGPHTFQVASVDQAGNVESNPPLRHFTVDTSVVALSAVTAAPTTLTAAITWQTSRPATSLAEYRVFGASAWTPTALDNSMVTAHTVNLAALVPATKYEYRAHSIDACGHEVLSAILTLTTLPDTTPPVVSVIGQPGDYTVVCGAAVTFTFTGTDNYTQTANLLYKYRIDSGPYSVPAAAVTASYTGLSEGDHLFQVEAIDGAGNISYPASRHITISVNPPVIANLKAVSVGDVSSAIAWNTNKPANSLAEYRIQGISAWSAAAIDPTLTVNHSVNLTGLQPTKTYEYRVHTTDSCGNETVSAVQTFTTLADTVPPVITITGTPADGGVTCSLPVTLTWTAQDDFTPAAQLQYQWQIDNGGYNAYSSATQTTFTTLSEGPHIFQARVRDAAGNANPNGAIRGFYVHLTAPQLSNFSAAPRDFRAVVTWTSNFDTTAQVDYGTTTAYGSASALDTSLNSVHQVTLTGLMPLTTYHYRVHSSDGCRETISADHTFTTVDILKPNFSVTSLTFPGDARPNGTLNVAWAVQNSGPGDALTTWTDSVYVSSKNVLDSSAALLGKFSAGNALPEYGNYSQSQTVTLPNLNPGTYYILVKADGDNTIAEADETDNTMAVSLEVTRQHCIIATPDQNTFTFNPNAEVDGQLQLTNLASNNLTNIQAVVQGAAANLTIKVTPPTTLAGSASAVVNYSIVAANDSFIQSNPVIHFTTAEGEYADVTLHLNIIPQRPALSFSPTSLSAGMVRGQQNLVQATLTNSGNVAANNLVVNLPSASWLSLASSANIGSLAPNQSTTITLALKPDLNLPLGPYTGSIAVNGTNGSATIGFSFLCASSGKGDLRVTGQDEFTYFADNHPNVEGAHVVLKDGFTGVVVADGYTDANGVFAQQAIPEGPYNMEVTADQHGTAKTSVMIEAGVEKAVNAFMPRTLVTYSWTVVPVDTPDHYVVTLQATFQTNVPAPVVTISPKRVDVRDLNFDANGQATVYFTVTNHGLVAANDTKLTFNDDPDYHFKASIEDLGKLAALTTVVVPVTVTKNIGPAQPRVSSDCEFTGIVSWDFVCGDIQFRGEIIYVSKGCPVTGTPSPPYYPPSSSGGNTANSSGGDPGGTGIYNPPPFPFEIDLCDPCLQRRLKAIYACYKTISKDKACYESITKAYRNCRNIALLAEVPFSEVVTVPICLYRLYKVYKDCQEAVEKSLECVDMLLHACDGLPGHQPLITRSSIALSPALQYLVTQQNRLEAHATLYAEAFGDPKWMQTTDANFTVKQAFLDAYAATLDPAGDTGERISDAERAALLALPLPGNITRGDVNKLVDRWNRTLDYYAANITKISDVPPGQSIDFIPLDRLDREGQAASDAADANIAEGYNSVFDGVNAAKDAAQQEILAPGDAGICAKVRVKLDQDITLTRASFKATLEVDNAPQNVELDNVTVTLNITDASQMDASAVFGVVGPTVTGVTNVSGTGILQPGTTATAQWLITPTRDAAPMTDTTYYVGGTLSYKQNGVTITSPLFPAAIKVKPDPLLQFHYFWQHDVYSDDPFTPEKEPSEPFALGMLVVNKGYGEARNLTITSSQPQIVDNEKGLLIDFKIIGSQINYSPISPSLMLNFGNLSAMDTTTATWYMTSTLAGTFGNFDASFRHVDDLGNPRTSLIDSVDIHYLEHVVRVDLPQEDHKPDFLTNDPLNNPNLLPNKLWNSDGTTSPVIALTTAVVDAPVTASHLVVHLTVANAPGGWIYIRTDDPAMANFRLLSVVRSDGRVILLNDNAWTTNRLVHPKNQTPYKQYRLYLFDKDTTGAYTLTYGQLAPADTTEGGAKGFSDGIQVSLNSGIVTGIFSDGLYVEAPDRSSGIKVINQSAAEGSAVSVLGTVRTNASGERYIDASRLTVTGAATVAPLGMTTKTLYCGDYLYHSDTGAGQRGMTGGSGLTTIGLLARTIGKVVGTAGSSFQIDDGYGRVVTVSLPTGVAAPSVGSVADVTGIVSISSAGGVYTPILRPRRNTDLYYNNDAAPAQSFASAANLLHVGNNLFSLPGIPANPSPVAVLNGLDPGNGSSLKGRLSRYDVPTQSEVFLTTPLSSDSFGNFLLGEGYRLRLNAGEPGSIAFSGYGGDFADRWISVAKLGAALIGDPFAYPVNWADVLVTDGTKTVTLTDAARTQFPAWLSSRATYFDSAAQVNRLLGLPDDNPDSLQLTPWAAYFVTSNRDNIALLIPTSGATISGVLTLESISPDADTLTVTFVFRPVGGGASLTRTALVGPDGAFTLTGLPKKNWTVWIKGPKYLAQVRAADTSLGNIVGLRALLLTGDANNDNSVDSSDFGIFIGAFNTERSIAGSGYDSSVDFNGDGFVDSTDFLLLLGNFNQAGAP